jgi:CheY-like chemotaxis protein
LLTKDTKLTAIQHDTFDKVRSHAEAIDRILVVEDNESVREVAVDFLLDHGYEIVEAEDGLDALQHLKGRSAFDLLFTDVNLPGGMSGLGVASEARQLQPNIKVLLTTGYSESIVKDKGGGSQAENVILKPYRQAKLLEMIRSLLGR